MYWFENLNPVIQALIATTFTWGITALGALIVCFFKEVNKKVLNTVLGVSAGVMIAASFCSLLAPSIDLSEELGYAREVKEFKQNPEKWPGHVGDISTVLRVSLTGRMQTPDLYEIMQVLGKESVEKRITKITER